MNKASPAKPVSTKLIFVAIILFTLTFIGAFGYSLTRSGTTNPIPGLPTNPQTWGTGQPNLPPGSTVQTKEEGIALCRQSGVDYCYSAVAAAFNDLNVCSLAPDRNKCEVEAKEFAEYAKESAKLKQ